METARKLKEASRVIDSMTAQEDLANFFNDPESAQKLNDVVEDIRYALVDYRVRFPKALAFIITNFPSEIGRAHV